MRKVLTCALALVILAAAPVSAATFADRDAFVERYVAKHSTEDARGGKLDAWALSHKREPRPLDGWAHEPAIQREAWVAFVVRHGYPKPPPAPEPVVATTSSSSYSSTPASASIWDELAFCESGGNWAENEGTIFDGGLQFHPDTWLAYGGGEFAPEAWQASREEQIAIAERVLAGQGWGAWPSCAAKLGLI